MTPGCPGVVAINVPVNQAIECHRRRTGEDHTQQNADQILPTKRCRLPRQQRRQQRKRQRKDRMAETNQFEESAERSHCGENRQAFDIFTGNCPLSVAK